MDGFQVICTIFVTIVTYGDMCGADHEYMVTEAEFITVPIDFETKLQCQMNIEPDKFQWKFYPLSTKDAFNPKAVINLTSSNFEFVPIHKYAKTTEKKESDLNIVADSKKIAGDYQCLAHYGASVVASVPWRITISNSGQFPEQENIEVTVIAGNTINWRCEPPTEANPEPYIEYYHNDRYIKPSTPIQTKSLIVPSVTTEHTGKYICKSFSSTQPITSTTFLNLKVVKSGPLQSPRFIMPPKKVYTVIKGGSVFLECAAVGNPIPEVVWKKKYGKINEKHSEMVKGGLIIKNVSSADDGVYECNQKNSRGSISHQITLIYNEPPKIDCLLNSTDVKQGENLDLDCLVTGNPEPQVSWFLNGFSVNNDSKVEVIGNKIYFRTVEKRHAGNLQIFARNVVKTVYSSISIKVIPLSKTQEISSDKPVPPTKGSHRNNSRKPLKHNKMVPPSKPIVSRLKDDAVDVRWTVQVNKGLPIQFFKVQYRELGPANQHDHHSRAKGSKWMTSNAIIPSHITNYEIDHLKSDHWYRFRIAAVYSNNDNKNSPNSEKFHLRKLDFDKRNPLPIPLITKTETINSTSVKIYWKYDPSPNITVEGFFVNYNSASSAGDYLRALVNGQDANSYVLSYLHPDTVYDIKLQSFNSNSASEYSSIMKAKTLEVVSTTLSPTKETAAPPDTETAGFSKLYIIVGGGVLGVFVIVIVAVGLLLFCRKWKHKKNNSRGDRDKSGVDEHHIQADDNEYVVGPKGPPRSNGCVPSNRITITANPLADADNKNQNMIEMSCLSSQNNNCSTVQPSVSGEDSPTNSRDKKNNKSREKRIRNKNVESNTSGENYV
ncbi:interference hedgehog-like [Asbolus verrucosus]|uniref:Interference hedgehog n=1 Tax=Asbolus verrucosus TaxID=1661398 RepID=A0A482VUM1_ASBVE|nr:interference hedgehog-like [Asbolus verrucosus]